MFKNTLFPRRVKSSLIELPEIANQSNVYTTFSIDPEGCKDIDDAFHITFSDKEVEVGIHIADVASRINLEKSDFTFFSSIYLDDTQINMLSDKITFDDASLGNGVIRRAVSLILKYDYCQEKNKFKLRTFEFQKTLIKNTALTYKQADKKISQGESKFKVLYDIMKQFSETDDSLHKISATKIVEYYMLLYNTKVAETLYKVNKGTILRRHTVADTSKITNTYSKDLTNYLTRINQNAAEYIRGDKENILHMKRL